MIGHIAHEHHGFLRVPCRAVGDLAFLDDDIRLGTVEHMNQVEAMAQEHGHDHHVRMAFAEVHPAILEVVGEPARRWDCRTIHYTFEPPPLIGDGLSNDRKKVIEDGIELWRATGIFRFKLGESDDGYLEFKETPAANSDSAVGRTPDPGQTALQSVSISKSLFEAIEKATSADKRSEAAREAAGTVAHEIGHALGLFHEHKRRDAASYLKFDWNAIRSADKLEQYTSDLDALKVGYYDFGSIMQYTTGGSSTPGLTGVDLLSPLDPNVAPKKQLGQREGLAMSDLNAATAVHTEDVSKIEVELVTGLQGTAGEVFLGLGGREFRLRKGDGRLGASTTTRFTLGDGADVTSASSNDPMSPKLSIDHVVGLPVYLRLEATDNPWSLNGARVNVTVSERHETACKGKYGSDFPEIPPLVYKMLHSAGLTLGPAAGWRAHLRRTKPDGKVSTKSPQGFVPHPLPSRPIHEVVCHLSETVTGGSGQICLGLGGRELVLPHSTYTFPAAELGGLTEGDLHEFPAYLSIWGTLERTLFDGTLIEIKLDPPGQPIELAPAQTSLPLADACGVTCHLKYKGAPLHHTFPATEGDNLGASVRKITVSIDAVETRPADARLYLGLGGREFGLILASGGSEPFELGVEANVTDAERNNPRSPNAQGARLSLLDVDTHPTYLRSDGTESWTLKSANVTVDFEAPCFQQFYWTRGASGSRVPTLSVTDRPMTVEFKAIYANLTLGRPAGGRCELIRTVTS